jgi:catechol 2,3-dioxygenase-like lactoylglutathione lyase family enzyme
MPRRRRSGMLGLRALAALATFAALGSSAVAQLSAPGAESTTASVLWQPSMNVFRRFEVPAERMYEFYGGVLGFKQLSTLDVGNGGGVARFQVGAQELKLTRRVADRSYESGGVRAATGLRLLTFYFADERELGARFVAQGLPAPKFTDHARERRRTALVQDPDGQDVELVIVLGATDEQLARIEVGLTVADLERSRQFYRNFVGLEELPPVDDERFGTRKHSYRHGATTISLRSFGKDLPADTGSGGIQYVVSDVEHVDALAKARRIPIDQPLRGLNGFDLRTLWLDDPDGVTNYFAETGASRRSRAPIENRR